MTIKGTLSSFDMINNRSLILQIKQITKKYNLVVMIL